MLVARHQDGGVIRRYYLYPTPVALLLLMPVRGFAPGGWSFWLALLVSSWVICALLDTPPNEKVPEPQQHILPPDNQPDPVKEVMDVRLATEDAGVRLFRGRLRISWGRIVPKAFAKNPSIQLGVCASPVARRRSSWLS